MRSHSNQPHNPSGALTDPTTLARILDVAAAIGCLMVLDEAFIDYVPHYSLVGSAPSSTNLVVPRSVAKFYAIPALRVWYAVTSLELAARISAFLPSWQVTTIAIDAAALALRDPEFDKRTITTNAALRDEFAQALPSLGTRVLPSAENFMFLELPSAWGTRAAICERLIRDAAIVVRDCGDYEGLGYRSFVRVAVKTRANNERLVAGMQYVVKVHERAERPPTPR